MSALTLLPPFSPLGVKSELELDSWLEDFLDLKSSYEEYEEKITMRRSLRIRDSNNQATHHHGKKRRKSLESEEIHQNKSENEEEEEEDTPKIPTSKLTLLLLRKEG